jgi:hypothetical protein
MFEKVQFFAPRPPKRLAVLNLISKLLSDVTSCGIREATFRICPAQIVYALASRSLPVYGDGYLANEGWWRSVQSRAYRDWIKLQYGTAN